MYKCVFLGMEKDVIAYLEISITLFRYKCFRMPARSSATGILPPCSGSLATCCPACTQGSKHAEYAISHFLFLYSVLPCLLTHLVLTLLQDKYMSFDAFTINMPSCQHVYGYFFTGLSALRGNDSVLFPAFTAQNPGM